MFWFVLHWNNISSICTKVCFVPFVQKKDGVVYSFYADLVSLLVQTIPHNALVSKRCKVIWTEKTLINNQIWDYKYAHIKCVLVTLAWLGSGTIIYQEIFHIIREASVHTIHESLNLPNHLIEHGNHLIEHGG